ARAPGDLGSANRLGQVEHRAAALATLHTDSDAPESDVGPAEGLSVALEAIRRPSGELVGFSKPVADDVGLPKQFRRERRVQAEDAVHLQAQRVVRVRLQGVRSWTGWPDDVAGPAPELKLACGAAQLDRASGDRSARSLCPPHRAGCRRRTIRRM